MTKTVTVFAASGTAGQACVNAFIDHPDFEVQVLKRKPGQQEKSSSGILLEKDAKQRILDDWAGRGVKVLEADVTDHADLIPALTGTDYLVSCVPIFATESQYPLIHAAAEAGVERFVPSEFGYIYEWEQFWPSPHAHRSMARQKAFIRRVIQLAGLDYTIIPAGLWPEYYMVEPVLVHGDGNRKVSWSCGRDVGRIIPHVLAHPASRNAVCPVAATAYLTWNELLAEREKHLGRPVERTYMNAAQWREAHDNAEPGFIRDVLLAIGLAGAECPEGMPLWANWNAMHLPDFKGTPLEQAFAEIIEPSTAHLTGMFAEA
ncbi:NmrA family NAD(P)-binding protein [Algiphilus sp.]|uniref:NmrA family NAD(P)-binding protein n=1 Tax=Algiphilus sp. TaxID=1872431 RepID=UPI0025C62668|nr:NmrA family NAD(P)-binding protein [Algiphilus sp.]MCK5769436.1 NmrA family NAD(P)-binding protein [Algiphilus sp.]